MATTDGRKEQVVVLASGFATRLGPLAREVPKALQPVGNETFLDAMLTPLRGRGFRRFHFCLGYLADAVRSYLERWEGELEISSSVERSPARYRWRAPGQAGPPSTTSSSSCSETR
ncbi:sugar phosphate nucleotidyltransferase [Streptomyces albulus]|nr:sugar phosphate nucleotidyltransferase [Streptomyces noursei]